MLLLRASPGATAGIDSTVTALAATTFTVLVLVFKPSDRKPHFFCYSLSAILLVYQK